MISSPIEAELWMIYEVRRMLLLKYAAIRVSEELASAFPDRRPDYAFHRWKQRQMVKLLC